MLLKPGFGSSLPLSVPRMWTVLSSSRVSLYIKKESWKYSPSEENDIVSCFIIILYFDSSNDLIFLLFEMWSFSSHLTLKLLWEAIYMEKNLLATKKQEESHKRWNILRDNEPLFSSLFGKNVLDYTYF